MTSAPDPVELAEWLLAVPSVTPARQDIMAALEAMLLPLGFEVHRLDSGGPPHGPVANLFATRGDPAEGPHLAFAGHLDVVPPGPGWTGDPFAPRHNGELLVGRGAVDMKGAVAAFVAACGAVDQPRGRVSLIVTGDEEGPAVHGTIALIAWMRERGIRPDMILVGEPTSVARLRDTVKIGRRGSVNMGVDVPGTQGHVAYPHLADNPLPRAARIMTALSELRLDDGTEWFQPSNLEVTNVEVGNYAHNVIPGVASLRLNIRFNDRHRGADLIERVREVVRSVDPRATVVGSVSGEAFVTPPGPLSALVADAIRAETGLEPELSTTGGTSDARFLSAVAPTVEFGLRNATMHKVDEAVAIGDLRALTRIYARVIGAALA